MHLLVRGLFLKKLFHACWLPDENKCLQHSICWLWLVINWLLIRYRGLGSEALSIGFYLFHRPHRTSVKITKPLLALFPYLRAGSIIIKWWRNARCHLIYQMSAFSITVERTSVFKEESSIWLNWITTTGHQKESFDWTAPSFFFFTRFVTDMGVGGRRMQNTLTPISPNGATRCLISRHQAINYTKVATTNFCAAVLDDKWNVQAATSEKLPSFFRGCVSLTLMMYNSLQLHLTCALNGSTNCTPRVMKKKIANQAKKSTVCTLTSHVST